MIDDEVLRNREYKEFSNLQDHNCACFVDGMGLKMCNSIPLVLLHCHEVKYDRPFLNS